MKKNLFINAVGILCAVMSFTVCANTVSKITTSSQTAEPSKPVSLTFTFANSQTAIACGLAIDWGDGKIEKLRVGEGQQLPPPYAVEHTYSSPGEYKIRVNGEAIIRGLRSVFPCDVKRETALTVIDANDAAKLADSKTVETKELGVKEAVEAIAKKELGEKTASVQPQQNQSPPSSGQSAQKPPTPAQNTQQKYVPDANKRYVGIIACDKDPSTPDTYNILKNAMKIYASGNMDAFGGFLKEMRKWCRKMNTPAQNDKLGNVVFEFEQGGRHFLTLAVNNGFQQFRQGNSTTMLPTWTIYGMVGE